MVFDLSDALRCWLVGDRPSDSLRKLLSRSTVQFVENEGIKITIPIGSYEEIEPFLMHLVIRAALFEGAERSFSVWESNGERLAYFSPRAIRAYAAKGISSS